MVVVEVWIKEALLSLSELLAILICIRNSFKLLCQNKTTTSRELIKNFPENASHLRKVEIKLVEQTTRNEMETKQANKFHINLSSNNLSWFVSQRRHTTRGWSETSITAHPNAIPYFCSNGPQRHSTPRMPTVDVLHPRQMNNFETQKMGLALSESEEETTKTHRLLRKIHHRLFYYLGFCFRRRWNIHSMQQQSSLGSLFSFSIWRSMVTECER